MVVNIKKLDQHSLIPTRCSASAAGYDLYARIPNGSIEIQPGATAKIGVGVAVEIPEGYFGGVFARSGLATKRGLRPANCVGVIDSDYRGEIIVALHNDADETVSVHDGDRIAQLVIIPYLTAELRQVGALSDTERGAGAFGSTGLNDKTEVHTMFSV